jgi:hypothetical protein
VVVLFVPWYTDGIKIKKVMDRAIIAAKLTWMMRKIIVALLLIFSTNFFLKMYMILLVRNRNSV